MAEPFPQAVDDLVSSIYCERPNGLDAALADLFQALALAVRECTRLVASALYLGQRPDDYRSLARSVADAVERARRAYLAADVRLRRAGGPNDVLSVLNDALTIHRNAPTTPTTPQELNPILTRIYSGRGQWFRRVDGRGVIDRMLDQLARVPPEPPQPGDRGQQPPAPSTRPPAAAPARGQSDHPSVRLIRVFTNGVSDDRIVKAAQVLEDEKLTTNEKLTRIDALLPLPPTASAEQLGELFGVTKQAVLKTGWWVQNRKGEKGDETGRRRAAHQKRAKEYESPSSDEPGE